MGSGLSIEGVHKRFGALQVLQGVDLNVEAATLTAVLGPSGCGKTTLLRIIAGFEQADDGRLVVDGTNIATLPPELRHVGVVPQEGALFPHLDVGRNVGFGIPKRGRSARVAECLELVGLAGFEAARPAELSGGQQQRVAVARALAPRPAVLLLDEPFAALDTNLRAQVRSDIADAVRASGTTTVLVTHDRDEALSLADHVAVMLHGRVLQVATPIDLYRHPVSSEVALFVGEAFLVPGYNDAGASSSPFGDVRVHGPVGDVLLVIRPEQVVLSSSGTFATITGVSYFGHDCLVEMVLADGSTVATRVAGHRSPAVGSTVHVLIDGVVSSVVR